MKCGEFLKETTQHGVSKAMMFLPNIMTITKAKEVKNYKR